MSEPEKTADGHYVIVDGRKWRASDPRLSEEERQRHVDELMSARRDVGTAKRRGDEDAVRAARDRVHAAKVALGERGPKWWEDEDGDTGSPGTAADTRDPAPPDTASTTPDATPSDSKLETPSAPADAPPPDTTPATTDASRSPDTHASTGASASTRSTGASA